MNAHDPRRKVEQAGDLQLVARGLDNKAIAIELMISESTVMAHMLHIFGKL